MTPYAAMIIITTPAAVTHRHLRITAPDDGAACAILNHLAWRAVEALPRGTPGNLREEVWRSVEDGRVKQQPAECWPPGAFLDDELRARGWTADSFAQRSGLSLATVLGVLAGLRRVGAVEQDAFSRTLGTSPEFWRNLERAWQRWSTRP